MEQKKKKKFIGLAICLVAVVAIAAMSYAWFTDTLSPLNVDVTAAKIKVTSTGAGVWNIGGDENLIGAALPGEFVSYGALSIKNESNREALARVFINPKGTLKLDNQNIGAATWAAVQSQLGNYLTNSTVSFSAPAANTLYISPQTLKLYFPEGFSSWPAVSQTAIVNQYKADILAKFGSTELVVDTALVFFLGDNVAELGNVWTTAVRTKIYYGAYHFNEILNRIANNLFRDKIAQIGVAYPSLITVSGAGVGKSDHEYYVALGIPTPGVDDVLDFGNLGFTIPNTLGGSINILENQDMATAIPSGNGESYNWNARYFNEQESTITCGIELKVIQGTKKAVTDVFGATVTNYFSNPANCPGYPSGFLTDN